MSAPDVIDARFAGTVGGFALDVAFTAPMRGITALFGPSGSGKTTVLRAVAGLSRLSGSLTVGGEAWQDDTSALHRPPHRRAVGYVFQEASLFPHLSVRRNLLYGARRSDARAAVVSFDDAVSLLGLERLLERGPDRLSGGERQRVAIGRALLSGPRLLLMDEPLSALDFQTKMRVQEELLQLWQRSGATVLYVTHDIDEALALADSVSVLSPRPATVLRTLDVPFGRPRSYRSVRQQPGYGALFAEIDELLRGPEGV